MCVLENESLCINFKNALIKENIIDSTDSIDIKNIYTKTQRGIIINHYIISISNKTQKLFARMVKEKDCSYHVMPFLKTIKTNSKEFETPIALTAPFNIDNHMYIITTYIEGNELKALLPTITTDNLIQISNKINNNLDKIHSITNDRYSLDCSFTDKPFNEIMFEKLCEQVHKNKCIEIFLNCTDQNNLLSKSKRILDSSSFSKPTLIHMDIKPENIIVSPNNSVQLIDYELARFGDIDYEWTNILIKTLISNNDKFNQFILIPLLEKNFMSLKQAVKVDKYKTYLLYLSMNMFIYYVKCDKECPSQIIELINMIIKQITNS